MRRPRSSRDAALLGALSGLSPLHSCGATLLDLAYAAALGAFAGMCIAFAAAWKHADPATVGRGVPAEPRNLLPLEPSNPGTAEHTEMKHDILTVGFLWALAGVESGHNDAAVNREEGAVGRFQIRQAYLDDANEVLGTHYALSEMSDARKAMTVVCAYLRRYGEAFEKRTGLIATPTDLARIHNGGPRGAEKDSTRDYARRFDRAYARCAFDTALPRLEVAAR